MITILVIAVIALSILVIVLMAYAASGNKTIKDKTTYINNLLSKLDIVISEKRSMEYKFRNLERELPNSLYAIDDKGQEVDYYRIKVMDEKDNFDGYNVGDRVPHIRRKVKYVWKNIPITLKLRRK